MFQKLGNFVVRNWGFLLLAWVLLLTALWTAAPPLETVVEDGEFAFLPADVPSLRGERLFREAFPDDLLASSIVIIARREFSESGLQQVDLEFIDDGQDDPDDDAELRERLEQLAAQGSGAATGVSQSLAADGGGEAEEAVPPRSIISRVRTYRDDVIGELLLSDDRQASLIIVELTTEFLERQNKHTIARVEQLVEEIPRPPGLDLTISGSATVGRDMLRAAAESADATELWTIILVVTLLIVIYRSPLLAFIPLITVFLAVEISLKLLTLAGVSGWLVLFQGVQVYVTVILYGAGVDYCLFLIARYKEELDEGASFEEGVANSLGKVGAAVTASAGTVICGIGMMVFAEFEKFNQAGIAISSSLVVVLLTALTFTPALLRLTGRWAFWPRMRTERIASGTGWISATSLSGRLQETGLVSDFWDRLGRLLVRAPGTIWLASVGLMLPFAVVGVLFYSHLSYGLLTELSPEAPSVVGTRAVQEHFPAGATGPVTVLLRNENVDFTRSDGIETVGELTRSLRTRMHELELAEVRSASHPLGGDRDLQQISEGNLARMRLARQRSVDYYVSREEEFDGHVTRIDLTADVDPFSRNSIPHLNLLEGAIREELPPELAESELYIIGPTASMRDLKAVTDRDQIRIEVLVTLGVFAILVVLLRRPMVSAYLIVSVLFSYFVTMGATFAFFWAIDPAGFSGLDWKVPMFLFTILIAVGEDYNIFLMTRIEEEQVQHGRVAGITVALSRTGRIISSCGIIMAGTFSSLMAGSLMGMVQLGFALAFGVLLDTFVVRPILVPAYLILLYSGRFGRFGKLLGAREMSAANVPHEPAKTHIHS